MKRIVTIAIAVVLLIAALVLLGVRSSEGTDPTLQSGTAATPGTTDPSQAPAATVPLPTQPPTTAPLPTEPPGPLFMPEEGSLLSRDFFVYDPEQGRFLTISGDADAILYPASITKLFTAYVALQLLPADQVITAGDELDFVAADSSIAYVRKGHKLTAAMLVEGMLLPSGNDAAYVLAAAAGRAAGGSQLSAADAIARFVTEMNAKAAQIGLTGTHFTNPDGYHDDGHYTTAADLVVIAQLALDNEIIARCVSLSKENVVYASGHTNTWHNSNLLVDPESPYYCPDAIGLKTGKTEAAGCCLLSAFRWEGKVLIMGVFGSEGYNDRFVDSLKLYEMTLNALT